MPKNHIDFARLDLSIVPEMRKSNNYSQVLSSRTRELYRTTGEQFNRYLTENKLRVNEQSIKSFLDSQNWKTGTVNVRRQALLKLLESQKSIRNDYFKIAMIKEVFKREVKRITVERSQSEDDYLTREQIDVLKGHAPIWMTLVIEFLFQTGCRVSEMINVRLNKIENMGDVCQVEIVGKGSKFREVYAKTKLVQEIRAWFLGKTHLFETSNNNRFTRQQLHIALKRVEKKAGIKVHLHMFRHSCAMHLKRMGKDANYIADYLGHSDVAITLRYYFHEKPGKDISDLF